jgi:hypothetical protein
VKGFIGFTTVGRRVYQRSDDLQKLDDRSRPPMRKYDWQGILVLRSDVNEVNPETVNLAAKLWKPIQCAFNPTPIVVSAPVFSERLCLGQPYTLGPIRYRFLVRPASIGKSLLKIVQCCLWYVDLEGSDIFCRRGEHELRSLVGARVGTYWPQTGGQYTGASGCGSGTYELPARDEWYRYFCSVF